MISYERWPEPAVRTWFLLQRFQKFLVVGSFGLGVNQGLLFLLRHFGDVRLSVASPVAIFVSMVVTFALNERWTWHDRGTGRLLTRLGYYCPINTVGLVINYLILTSLVHEGGMHYLTANLVGAGAAAVWNFALNNFITWKA